ncbi:hypothetical protein MB46_19915 (plasmid) [Arthrobacter alpinus]|uniref:hypothetical protein n=1 Tax=Arthrobacter alpinus TaxID=656366 RepID=UPI0005CADD56|nr:hypothetical protein [Arthrobacter alpinus]ALV47933.1 hypothetical protein MB46_19915 [Arthrobacter alpinus]
MRSAIRLPYSNDHAIVESRCIKSLLNLPIVSLTLRGQTINLSQDTATAIGTALLLASTDEDPPVSSHALPTNEPSEENSWTR